MKITIAPTAPDSVTPLQFRRALRALGMTAAVDAYIATLDPVESEEWEYAVEIIRLHPSIEAARVAFEFTEAERDAIFILAASL